ncbi:hypothetical protein BU24DRAFT_157242 [Aaosphaeria arxii CBS 175.79]|uniref:Uncharacterized protein n=1 Tax=Aaosphaeria arxii CBS 175.79 TaxID=1450172 RepID=A0A6A5XY18_9PLEO|nr:uncharacterized protein BU24DRAFT_157242 [Aaosphaeria arxii CBS 175.79]KAF2017727.1 hypothetical protein BU24DRAFT_157242 [Aaosphaeria arxii CBS 175.79]
MQTAHGAGEIGVTHDLFLITFISISGFLSFAISIPRMSVARQGGGAGRKRSQTEKRIQLMHERLRQRPEGTCLFCIGISFLPPPAFSNHCANAGSHSNSLWANHQPVICRERRIKAAAATPFFANRVETPIASGERENSWNKWYTELHSMRRDETLRRQPCKSPARPSSVLLPRYCPQSPIIACVVLGSREVRSWTRLVSRGQM